MSFSGDVSFILGFFFSGLPFYKLSRSNIGSTSILPDGTKRLNVIWFGILDYNNMVHVLVHIDPGACLDIYRTRGLNVMR